MIPASSEVVQLLPNNWQTIAEQVLRANTCRTRAPARPEVAQVWSTNDQARPCSPSWAKFGRDAAKIGHNFAKKSAKFGLGQILDGIGQVWSESGPYRPEVLDVGLKLASRSNCSTNAGQLFGNLWTTAELTGIAGDSFSGRLAGNLSEAYG